MRRLKPREAKWLQNKAAGCLKWLTSVFMDRLSRLCRGGSGFCFHAGVRIRAGILPAWQDLNATKDSTLSSALMSRLLRRKLFPLQEKKKSFGTFRRHSSVKSLLKKKKKKVFKVTVFAFSFTKKGHLSKHSSKHAFLDTLSVH